MKDVMHLARKKELDEAQKTYSFAKDTLKRLGRNKLAVIGAILLLGIILSCICAPLLTSYDYAVQDLANAYRWPTKEHIFGTDEFGRDIFCRVLYGGRISLTIGFVAVGVAVIVGGLLGALAGYYGKVADNIIMRCMDLLMSIPQLLLAIAITATLGSSMVNLMIAVGITTVPAYARIVRASVLSLRDQEFIEAARAVGMSNIKIIIRHILPNCLAPIIVQTTISVAIAILTAAALSFIGIGLPAPTPEWGAMLTTGRYYIRDSSYMTLFPGLALAGTLFSLNVLGDGLRDALDPKLRD